MKKSILIFLFMGLISCNSQEKKETSFVNVNVEEFQKLISTKGAQLIDVRTFRVYEKGHIKNALLIDYMSSDFKTKAFKGIDKSKPVLLYCTSGVFSARSAKMYKEAGFKKVYNLVGGFRAWKAKNLEIEK
jgi:rhodanese-related sulfurtransferase